VFGLGVDSTVLWLITLCQSQMAWVQILAPPYTGCVTLACCLATLCLSFRLHKSGYRCSGVPFSRKRQHHTCPCLPNLLCSRALGGRYRCSADLKNINF
uniref:Prokineticin domain-containing protein n=1 Tax=Sus scrofa TaxID=9823 RepID=A0A8D0U3W1_PIG